MEELAEIAGVVAAPEICDHLHAYMGDRVLLLWYDAFHDTSLFLSRDIEEESVRTLCRTLHCHYTAYR
jgi:hypothetical protein